MRSGVRGVLTGALGLVALQTLVQPGASGRVAGLFGVPARVARRFLDPTIPAIPDRRGDDEGSLRQGLAERDQGVRRFPDPFSTGAPRASGGD